MHAYRRPQVIKLGSIALAVVISATLALLVVLGIKNTFGGRRIGVPVPLAIYEIEATSGTHQAHLLNLPVAPLGVVGLPIPVDVDGDLLPDVTVAVNLVNVSGLFNNPPNVPAVLAPNLEINRILPGINLTPVNPPLRIDAKITVLNVGGSGPNTVVRLGYDTGAGGAIPNRFKVTAGGLLSFFNPVTASVDAPGYEGPLTVVAGFEQGTTRDDADLRFAPLPTGLQFSYGTDSAGQHVSAVHNGAVGATAADQEVDLAANIKAVDGPSLATLDARIDRLPRSVAVTIQPGQAGGGGLDYIASADGRLPDVRLDVQKTAPNTAPLAARVDVEGLPPEVHAQWALPDNGPAHVRVAAPQRPIGAIEARVANFLGDPTKLPTYLPTAEQFVDLRQSADGKERLVGGRVEGINLTELTQTDRGVDAHFQSAGVGRPVELHASLGSIGEAKRRLDAITTVSPLPAEVVASIRDAGADQAADPMTISYTSSDSIDVDGHVEARDANVSSSALCGDKGTICADLKVRDIPTSIVTKIARLGKAGEPTETRVSVDSVPRANAAKPDVFANLTMGATDGSVVQANASALSIPDHVDLRLAKTKGGSLERTELHTCDRNYDTRTCATGSEGALGSISFGIRNFTDASRPPTMPRPALA
ncbi:MAG: hypothetical protein QOE63_1352, partial [Acidimicrobiaceae bacterium]